MSTHDAVRPDAPRPHPLSDLALAVHGDRNASSSTLTLSSTSEDHPRHQAGLRASSDRKRPQPPSSVSDVWEGRASVRQTSSARTKAALVDFGDVERVDRPSTPFQETWPGTESDDSDEATPGVGPSTPSIKSGKKFFRKLGKRLSKLAAGTNALTFDEDWNHNHHTIVTELYEGRLHLAPVVKPRKVMDIGTGMGHWPIDFARLHPNAHVLGVDLNYVPPPAGTGVPPNCRLRVMDATQDWNLDFAFDFIHGRSIGDFPGKDSMLQSVYDHLAPGGYAEFSEWIMRLQSPNHSLDGTAFLKWETYFKEGLLKIGGSITYALRYPDALRRLGFEGIVVTKSTCPNNACYPGRRIRRVGTMMAKNWRLILEPVSEPVFCHGLGWDRDRLDALLADVYRELEDVRHHSFLTLYTVYARKPFEADARSRVTASSASTHSVPASERARGEEGDTSTIGS